MDIKRKRSKRVKDIIKTCEFCFKEFSILPCYKLRRFCSEKCWQKYIKGKNNPNYKNGKTNKNDILRTSKKYSEWRKNVFIRDKYTCQGCKKIGGQLEAHHIIPVSEDSSLIFEINNGITLCKKCHKLLPNKKRIYEKMNNDFVIIKTSFFNQLVKKYENTISKAERKRFREFCL